MKFCPLAPLLRTLTLVTLTVALQGCGGGDGNNTSTSASASYSGGPLRVSQLSPPGGIVSQLPASVVITFSETNLDLSQDGGSVLLAANYQFQCNGNSYSATGVSFNSLAGTATVYFPQLNSAPGETCSVTLSSSIADTSGNSLGSAPVASFQVASFGIGGLYVQSFSPAAGVVAAMPTLVTVSFSEQALDLSGGANSEINPANYTYNCGGATYFPDTATSNGNGTISLTVPAVTPAVGSVCVVGVAPNLDDAFGNVINIASNVTYTMADTSNTWMEAGSPTLTASAGVTGVGQTFLNNAQSGLALSGLTVNANFSYLSRLGGVWQAAFDPSANVIQGPVYPVNGGGSFNDQQLLCPAGMQLNGVVGTADSQLDSLGILCQSSDQTQTYESALAGGSGANAFQLSCPAGQFATALGGSYIDGGYSGSAVESIELGCQ